MRPLFRTTTCFTRPLLGRLPRGLTLRRILTTSTTNNAHTKLPKIIITPGSAHHNSLPSFLEYSKRTKLNKASTVFVGTHYEYVAALSLLRLGFSLLRTGRRADAGIDLMGHWILPPLPEPLLVIAQCKARNFSCAPKNIRELEGAFQGIPPEWQKKNVLGLLVTTEKATKGVLTALGSNRWPMGFVKISRSGTIEQFVWNRAAAERGLEGVGVGVRYTPRILLGPEIDAQGEEGGRWRVEDGRKKNRRTSAQLKLKHSGTKRDILLTWMGTPIFPDREELDQETMKLMGVIAKEEVKEVEPVKPRKKKTVVVKAVAKKLTRKTTKTMASIPVKRGRPPGSKNKKTLLAEAASRKRGRPPGSKNKVVISMTPK